MPKEVGKIGQTEKDSPTTKHKREESRVEERKEVEKREEGRMKRAASSYNTKTTGITINVYNEKK